MNQTPHRRPEQSALPAASAAAESPDHASPDFRSIGHLPDFRVVELRRYTTSHGGRARFASYFDSYFPEAFEQLGAMVFGQFLPREQADRFVWLRGFPDMETRAAALQAFYTSAVWRQHRDAANATMIDSDDVLLLEPATRNTRNAPVPDRGPKSAGARRHLVVITIWYLRATALETFPEFFATTLRTPLMEAGAAILGEYVTSKQPNSFPGLPIREGERAFVTLARFESQRDHEAFQAKLAADPRWQQTAPELAARLEKPVQTLRLAPTSRSRL